ncbi:hypothetical protein EDB83DRAFT_2521593 [Lactarius deliciosus]|nr:hypothetical protein EDB83DRAFT_2521593 [Lactarius deliciosus]
MPSVLTTVTVPSQTSRIATPFAVPMDDMRVKHTWDAVPSTWEYLGGLPGENYEHPDTPGLVGSRLAYYGVTVLLHLNDTREQLADDH